MCIGIHVNYVKFERHAWPYPPCINCLLIYKMPYPSYRFDDAKLLESGNPVSYTITPTLLCITFGCNFTDIINVSLRFGHDFSTMICSVPIGGAFNNVSARCATERTPP